MTRELDEALVRDFPLLYAWCWGFECGDGWELLLRRLSEKLEPMIRKWIDCSAREADLNSCPRASQVKEKFGTLRFYITNGTDAMYAAIREAEEESSRTCEDCGAPATTFSHRGWLRTTCEVCREAAARS